MYCTETHGASGYRQYSLEHRYREKKTQGTLTRLFAFKLLITWQHNFGFKVRNGTEELQASIVVNVDLEKQRSILFSSDFHSITQSYDLILS